VNRPPKRLWPLVVGGVLLWLVAVIPAYYVVHKPLNNAQVTALVGRLADLGLLALTLTVAAAWGSRIGRWLGLAFEPGVEQWTLGAILGLGLLGTLVLGLAAIGGLYRWVGYALLLVLGLAGWSEIRALWRWLSSGLRQIKLGRPSWLLWYAGVVGLLSLGVALQPPTAWDALAYHLVGPQAYVAAHRLLAVPENFYLNWPAQVEMLFTWGLLLKGDILAQLYHWAFWLLTAALLYTLARRTVDERGAQWAVVLWAAVPLASSLAGWPYVDLGLAAFVLAAVYAFLRWSAEYPDREASRAERVDRRERTDPPAAQESRGKAGWLALSALFAGLAIATKYTAVTWLGAILLLFIYHAWRHQHRSIGWIAGRAVGYGALAGLVAVPWLIKNWAVTGNPVYPLLFGGAQWNSLREASLLLSGHGYSHSLLDYLALPWLVTVLGVGGTGAFDAAIGPLLLCLTPLALLIKGRPRAVNYALVLVGAQWVYFVISIYRYVFMAQTRLLLPAFPLLCLVAAFAIRRLAAWDRPTLRLSWVVSAAVILILAINLLTEAYAFVEVRPVGVLVGLESRQDYLSRRLGAYSAAMRTIDEHLPADARLLFLWEPRGYYSRRPAQADPTLDNLAQLRLAYGDPDEALAALKARGFTHLLFYTTGLELLRGPTPRAPTLGTILRPNEASGQDRSGGAVGNPPAEQSYYPITDEDVRFLEALLTRCRLEESIGGSYEIYRLP
jgi:Dolichyl-phosphate-mannose-protein mannosyltransferase